MPTATRVPCLDSNIPGPFGVFVSSDPNATVPEFAFDIKADRFPSILPTILGTIARGSTALTGTIQRLGPITAARMVEFIGPELTATLDADDLRARTAHGLYLDVMVAEPERLSRLADALGRQAIPIDAQHEPATDPAAIAGLRVIPERHIVNRSSQKPWASVPVTAFTEMKGQLRSAPGGWEIGLPPDVVNERHAGPAPRDQTMSADESIVVADHLDLAMRLSALKSGDRAVVQVSNQDGVRQYPAVKHDDGIALLSSQDGRVGAAVLPADGELRLALSRPEPADAGVPSVNVFNRAVAWADGRTDRIRDGDELARGDGIVLRAAVTRDPATGLARPIVDVLVDPSATALGDRPVTTAVMLRSLRDVLRQLAGARPGTTLFALIGAVPGVEVTRAGTRLTVADSVTAGPPRIQVDATVPYAALPRLLKDLRDQIKSTTKGVRSELLDDGLRFGKSIASGYAEWRTDSDIESRNILEGYLSNVYLHVAAAWHAALSGMDGRPRSSVADLLVVTSERDLNDDLESLPSDLRDFLRENHDLISRRIQLDFVANNPGRQKTLVDRGLLSADGQTVTLSELTVIGKRPIGRYLSNALLDSSELRRRGIGSVGQEYIGLSGRLTFVDDAGPTTRPQARLTLTAQLPDATSGSVQELIDDLVGAARDYHQALAEPADPVAARDKPSLAPMWHLRPTDRVESRVLTHQGQAFATIYPLSEPHAQELTEQAQLLRAFTTFTHTYAKPKKRQGRLKRTVERRLPWNGERTHLVLGRTDAQGNHVVALAGRGAVRLDGTGIAADLHRSASAGVGMAGSTEHIVIASDRAALRDPDTDSSFMNQLDDGMSALAQRRWKVSGTSGKLTIERGGPVPRLTASGRIARSAAALGPAPLTQPASGRNVRFTDGAPASRLFAKDRPPDEVIRGFGSAGPQLFVVSTAVAGPFSAVDGSALPFDLVDQIVERLGTQYPDARIQLVGPDPGSRLRDRHPEAFALIDEWAKQERNDDESLTVKLGRLGATLIGTTADVQAVSGEPGLRTLWLGGDGEVNGPIDLGPANSQRLDLPTDWAAHLDAVSEAIRDLPDSSDAVAEKLTAWRASVSAYRSRVSQNGVPRGNVDRVRETRHAVADGFHDRLSTEIRELSRHRSDSDHWNAFLRDADVAVTQLSSLSAVEVYGLLRRAVDNEVAFGAAVTPERIKTFELAPAGDDDIVGSGTVGVEVRANPLLTSLADLTAEHFTSGSSSSTWQFIVTADQALPQFGSENVGAILPSDRWSAMTEFRLAAARRAVLAELTGRHRPSVQASLTYDPLTEEEFDTLGSLLSLSPAEVSRISHLPEVRRILTSPQNLRAGFLTEARRAASAELNPVPLTAEETRSLTSALSFDELVLESGITSPPPPDEVERILRLPEVRRILAKDVSKEFDGLGHPTDSGTFDGDLFRSTTLQVGGEVRYDREFGVLVFNDMSGRSMSPKVRTTQPEKFKSWVSNVARMVSVQTGLPWEIGLSKQAAKAAIKKNPNDIAALAHVSIIKAGLSDRGAVARLRSATAELHVRVRSALVRLPESPARQAAITAWNSLRASLAETGGSPVGAAERAVSAYIETASVIAAAIGRPDARLLPDPAHFFPMAMRKTPTAWHFGKTSSGEQGLSGEHEGIAVRFRENPAAEDFALLRVGLLTQPVDDLRIAFYRPEPADLDKFATSTASKRAIDLDKVADYVGLPVDLLISKLPDQLRSQPPERSTWVDRAGRPTSDPQQQVYLRVHPKEHIVEQHLDRHPDLLPPASAPWLEQAVRRLASTDAVHPNLHLIGSSRAVGTGPSSSFRDQVAAAVTVVDDPGLQFVAVERPSGGRWTPAHVGRVVQTLLALVSGRNRAAESPILVLDAQLPTGLREQLSALRLDVPIVYLAKRGVTTFGWNLTRAGHPDSHEMTGLSLGQAAELARTTDNSGGARVPDELGAWYFGSGRADRRTVAAPDYRSRGNRDFVTRVAKALPGDPDAQLKLREFEFGQTDETKALFDAYLDESDRVRADGTTTADDPRFAILRAAVSAAAEQELGPIGLTELAGLIEAEALDLPAAEPLSRRASFLSSLVIALDSVENGDYSAVQTYVTTFKRNNTVLFNSDAALKRQSMKIIDGHAGERGAAVDAEQQRMLELIRVEIFNC